MPLWGQPAPSASISPPNGNYTSSQFDPNQFSDPSNRAYDILSTFCGPELAITFSRYLGRNLTPDVALQIAQQYGYRRGQGMSGPQSQKNLLDALGIPAEYSPEVNWKVLSETVGQGAIGGVSTPGHYFALQGFNPTTGQFDTGESGSAYRAGGRYLTPGQISSLGGNPQGQYIVRQQTQGVEIPNAAPGQSKSYGNPLADRAAIIAQQYGIPPDIFVRQIRRESNFNPAALSPAGAGGLGQLMPDTARSLGVVNVNDPEENLQGSAKYLAGLLKQFNGDIRLALAAYNAGPGAVQRYGGVPPFQETQTYLRDILGDTSNDNLSLPSILNTSTAYTNIRPSGGLFGSGPLSYGTSQQTTPPLPSGGLFNTGAFMSLFQNPFTR